MSSLFQVILPTGRVQFAGIPRSWDEIGRYAFSVELPNQPAMYGEWRAKFAENDNDFDVEIVSFGFLRASSLGDPTPAHRRQFSEGDISIIQELIVALIASPAATAQVVPFTSKKGKFLGKIHFLPGWVRS